MNAKMDELINDIGNLIMDTADVEFSQALLYVEAEEGAIAPDLFYRTLDNKYVYRFADNELVNKVYDLYTEFQSTGKQPWTTFSYALGQDNKFSIDFGYDDIKPDDENCEARKALWIKEHLGDVEIDYPK
jgi:hypothetical protein